MRFVCIIVLALIFGSPIVASGFLFSPFRAMSDLFKNLRNFGETFLQNTSFLNQLFRDDPTWNMTAPEMIRSEGYPVEIHEVYSDGYILTLHRIPGKPGAPGVFIQHGLLGSSTDWILTGKHKSLAFILSDLGYDVWLENSRGNTYSRKHKTIEPDSSKFWKFSWHEMGTQDLPAAIDYASKIVNDSLIYISFSQGTTQFFVMASEMPDFAAEKIKASLSLAPVVYVSNMISPLRYLSPTPISYLVESFYNWWSHGELLPHSSIVNFFGKYGCSINMFEKKFCANVMFGVCGFNRPQFNYTLLPKILNSYPAGSSVYTIVHYGQEIRSGRFEKFDYGSRQNLRKYKQSIPPSHDLSKIKVPVGIFWSDNDWLTHPSTNNYYLNFTCVTRVTHVWLYSRDVQKLYDALPNKILNFKIDCSRFNHLDWLWAVDAPTLVYNEVIDVIEKYKR